MKITATHLWIRLLLLVLSSIAFSQNVFSTIANGNADLALGQDDLTSSYPNVVSNDRFVNSPGNNADAGKIFGDTTRVFVVDQANSRVLFWNSPEALTNGKAADGVIGQASFAEGKINRGGAAGSNTLNKPCGVFSLQSNFVWIADCGNNRVLRFTSPPTLGATADLVLGQADFTSTGVNRGGSIAANTLNKPTDITRGQSGDIWVADSANHRVLKYSAGSLASGMNANVVLGAETFTVEGWGSGGADSAHMNDPKGISIDGFGNVWVADTKNNRVLKFTAPITDGQAASVVLGQGDFTAKQENRGAGYGAPAANSLNFPAGVAASGDANSLWVADTKNNRLLKYAAPYTNGMAAALVLGTGTLTGFNGGGGASTNTFINPNGVCLISGTGDVWVADSALNRALKFIDPAANGTDAGLVLGSPDFTTSYTNSTQADGLRGPSGVVYEPRYGRFFTADSFNNRVLWWNSSAALTSGRPADGVLGQANFTDKVVATAINRLFSPGGLAIDPSGNLWVADKYNHRVVRYPGAALATGMNADMVLGQADFTSGASNRGGAISANTMYYPGAVSISKNGDVWVADSFNSRVLGFQAGGLTNGGNANFVLGQADFSGGSSNRGGGINNNTLAGPEGVYVDTASRVWVADGGNGRVLRFDAPAINGQAALVLGQNDFTSSGGLGRNKLGTPQGVVLDFFGNVWVAERDGNDIKEYSPPLTNGMLATPAAPIGQADYNSYDTNRGEAVAANTLAYPYALALDSYMNLYAADQVNSRVTVYNSGLSATALNPYVSARTAASLTISWNTVAGANYVPVLFADDYVNVVVGSSGTQSGNSKIFTSLSAATTYYFEVKLSTESDLGFSFNRISSATLSAPPAVSAITPSSGTNAGTVDITDLAGTDFVNGATVKLTKTGQTPINAVSVNWVNATQITCTLPLTGAATGTWNIIVTNPDAQTGQLVDGFTISQVPPAPAAITPNTGANNATVAITNLAGTGFQTGAAVKLTRAGEFDIAALNVSVVSTLKITCNLPLTGATTGTWDIVVTNPNGQSGTFVNGFTIDYPAPSIVNITPKASVGNAPIHITNLAGTGFLAGTTVKLTKAGQADINGTGVNIVDSTMLTCDFNILGAAAGGWDSVVTVPGHSPVTLANAFFVLAQASVEEPARVYQGIFNPAKGDKSQIVTHVAAPGKFTVKVYDSGGRLVRDIFEGDRNSGDYTDEWNGRNKDGSKVASGVYLIRIEGPGVKTTKRVLVVK